MKKLVTSLIALGFMLGLSAAGYAQTTQTETGEKSETVIRQQQTTPTGEYGEKQRTQTEVKKKVKTKEKPGMMEERKTKTKVKEQRQ